MPYILLALAGVVGLIVMAHQLSRANPQTVAVNLRRTIGAMAIVAAGLLSLRGLLPLAVPVFLFGLGMLGIGSPQGFNFPFGGRSAGKKSRVRTSMLAMQLEHDTGKMDGEVLHGEFEGRWLSGLSLDELLDLLEACADAGDQSQALLEAWLDRSHPGWRGGDDGAKGAGRRAGPMSEEEACSVLGVKPEATRAEIHAAHRRMMKKYHPDAGGSDYLAAKINEAKAVLLGE